MLEKRAGVRNPEKLRAITLMEADINFPNKLFFGKQMMDWADENEEHMPVEAYGSWKHHQSIDMSIS
jgi:hypothetical protein